MSSRDTATDLERQRFFDGQRLFAADLQFLVDTLRRSNERHNRLLHGAGVAKGLAVEADRGDREVVIGPGLALDSEGREIVLAHAHTEQVPAVDSEEDGRSVYYDLTVSYPQDEDLDVAETRSGLCETHGVVRLEVEPVFCWVRLERLPDGTFEAIDARLRADIQQSRKIRVARVEILHCAVESLTTAERRSARPPARPYLACGRSQPEWTAELFTAGRTTLFLLADVDTTGGDFTTTPHYFARLSGPRVLTLPDGEGGEGDAGGTRFAADGTVSIEAPTDTGFRARILVQIALPSTAFSGAEVFARGLDTSGDIEGAVDLEAVAQAFAPWGIEWMGIS